MTWTPLLLTDPSPCLRWLVLRHLFGYAEDHAEVQELAAAAPERPAADGDPVSSRTRWLLEAERHPDELGLGSSRVFTTAFALTRLGYLGFDRRHPAVESGAAYLFAQQRAGWLVAFAGREPMPDEEELHSPPARMNLADAAANGFAPARAGSLRLR